MEKSHGKIFALLLALVLMVPFWWNQSVAVASAATPTFTQSTVKIVGGEETYQLEIKNKVTGSKYKWSSSNTKAAKISSKGLVTTVGKGSSTVKCKITYSSGKTKTISCKVSVTIPATEIKINNAVEVNDAHVLLLNESFNFNRDIIPSGSSDKTYWYIDGGNEECLRMDNSGNGTVTGIKVGKAVLVAVAAKTTSPEDLEKSIIKDSIIIEVVAPSASVGSAEIVGSTEVKVVFDSQIDKSTVIDANNKLMDSIEITTRKDVKGVMAKDPGALTASLSADLKTLIITSTNSFDGQYGINLTSKIKTAAGVAIEEYYQLLSYIDNMPPSITGVSLDDTGMMASIIFNEAINFTNLKVSNATVIATSATTASAEQSTIGILNNKLNYIVSTDKKSLSINLSKIAAIDYGKTFSIIISGIADMSGNTPTSFALTTSVRTDNSLKAQAVPYMVVRTAYNIITATFSRAIQTPGWLSINGSFVTGTVDENDYKKVNYPISDFEAQYTGVRKVSISAWNSYNVAPTDTSASIMRDFNVDFTADKTSPVLYDYEFDVPTSTLILSYNEEVTLASNEGVFSSTLITNTDDIKSGTIINYTKTPSTDNKIIKLKMTNMASIGNYTFTLDLGFVTDSFKNKSSSRNLTIITGNGGTNELPGPYAVIQSATNLSEIYLEFANKLDLVSAQTASNYTIPGATVLSAILKNNTSDNGATVLLTVADGTITATIERPVKIKGVKGYNGSFTEIIDCTKMIELKENLKPTYMDPPVFDKIAKNVIRLNFSEQIKGNLRVRVTQYNSSAAEYSNTVIIDGNRAYIQLVMPPANGTYLKVEVLENTITDINGNALIMQNILNVPVSY